MIGFPAKNPLPILAHDSQVVCGQRLGTEFGSCSSWFSHPWTAPEIRQSVRARQAKGLGQEKQQKKSQFLVEFLKPSRIKQGGSTKENYTRESTSCTFFISLETLMLAAYSTRDTQVACRLNQPMNHMLISALDPRGRPFPFTFQCLRSLGYQSLLPSGPLWDPNPSLPCSLHS